MATNVRRSRLPGYTGMHNGNNSTQTSLGNTMFGTATQSSSPWNNSATASFAMNRDTVTPRDTINGSTSALRGTKGNWIGASMHPYGSADSTQPRPRSGNTSPRSRSDASSHDMNTASRFFPVPSTAPQAAQVGSRGPNTATTLESSNRPFRHAPNFSDFGDDGDSGSPNAFLPAQIGPELAKTAIKPEASNRAIKYPFDFPGYPEENGEDRFPKLTQGLDFTMAAQRQAYLKSLSSRRQSDHQGQANSFSDLSYANQPARPTHSQRPSFASSTFQTQNSMSSDQNAGRQNRTQMEEAFSMLVLDGTSNGGAVNNLGNGPSYDNGIQSFQLNPGSQPWEVGQGYVNGFAKDAYANETGLEKRGSVVGMDPILGVDISAGSASQAGVGWNGGSWSRPPSRDPRLVSDLERRVLGQHLVTPSVSPYYSNSFIPPDFSQYPPYSTAYGNPRHPAHMAGYGFPLPAWPLPGAIPTRPAREHDPGRALRSPLLYDFKHSPKSRRWELKDIWGHIVEFSGDQQASRFIQLKLETANSDERDQVFAEIAPNALQLMKDVFGNYVMQKLFEYGDQVQKKVLANAMRGRIVDLSMQPYSCRVVQKALQHVLVEQQTELVRELESDLITISKDQHGNHVVQQVIQLVPREHIDFIMTGLRGHVCELASHQYGCRVIQRFLEHGTEADKVSMMLELHNNAEVLVTDQFGNYVIQHVLEKGSPEDRSRMIGIVTPQLLALSRHKNASNVVEKCILFGTLQEQRAIRDQLLANADEANSPLFQLMKDQFGNYVIQKLVKALRGADRTMLVDKLASHVGSLKKSGATNKQIEAMERLVCDNKGVSPSTYPSNDSTSASSAPASPGLYVDVQGAPTPNLTTDPNSPLSTPSSHAPDLGGDATAEGAADHQAGGQLGAIKKSSGSPSLSLWVKVDGEGNQTED
ncbi:ARM repeat-containing protein [Parathielavia appendiculata]|uniref:ARM repeat-containing protein n=1 Tax=Parathielavia appendiculata TaxID=2587402 RepID=A0AAN6TYQ5_9PEZI|nr:ARM repeat-containing protein [Parathielavia appendiculata]